VAYQLGVFQETGMPALDDLGEHEPRDEAGAQERAVTADIGQRLPREHCGEDQEIDGDESRGLNEEPCDPEHGTEIAELQIPAYAAPDEAAIVPEAVQHELRPAKSTRFGRIPRSRPGHAGCRSKSAPGMFL